MFFLNRNMITGDLQSMKKLFCFITWLVMISSTSYAAQLVHGSSFDLTGSSFGGRTIVKEIFDNGSNSNISTLWNDAAAFSYSTPAALGRNVPLPHQNINKYAVGMLNSTWSAWLSTYVTGITYPTNMFVMAYRRVDPLWQFGSQCGTGSDSDNNFKFLAVTAGTSWFATPYWYHDQTGQKCSLTGSWDNSFYSSGGLGKLGTSWSGKQGGSGDIANDMWHQWVKSEYRVGLGPSGQILKYLTNNKYYQNLTGMNTFDAGGSDGAFSIGAYARQYGKPNQFIYLADVVMVIGPDAFKRVILSNSSTYNSSTIVEFQPILSWTNTSIKISGNLGAIPNGTAFLHVFLNASDTPAQTIPVTIGDQGSTSPQAPTPPQGLRIVN
jgi:hypothetical protein